MFFQELLGRSTFSSVSPDQDASVVQFINDSHVVSSLLLHTVQFYHNGVGMAKEGRPMDIRNQAGSEVLAAWIILRQMTKYMVRKQMLAPVN